MSKLTTKNEATSSALTDVIPVVTGVMLGANKTEQLTTENLIQSSQNLASPAGIDIDDVFPVSGAAGSTKKLSVTGFRTIIENSRRRLPRPRWGTWQPSQVGSEIWHFGAYVSIFGTAAFSNPDATNPYRAVWTDTGGMSGTEFTTFCDSAAARSLIKFYLRVAGFANVRFHCGFTSTVKVGMDTDYPLCDYALFRYDTGIGDTEFMAVTTGDGGGTLTEEATGVAPADNPHIFEVRLIPTAGRALFLIDETVVANVTTNLPNAVVGPFCYMTVLSGAGQSMAFEKMWALSQA